MTQYTEVLILGTGIAGLSASLKIAPFAKVLLVCKDDPLEGSTRYAQGGIASVWSERDSFASHISDTLNAGADLCHLETVQMCVQEGPQRIKELIELGVQFTQIPGKKDISFSFDLHQEGGHQTRRILHTKDQTGLTIAQTLLTQVKQHPHITILDHHMCIQLISDSLSSGSKKCYGTYLLDLKTGVIKTVFSQKTILATGGAGKVYLYTSNPDTATGDGIAMAYQAGADIANMEFIQFHPTCFYHSQTPVQSFLISEALRGEGAFLTHGDKKDFVFLYDKRGSLAPRDIVSQIIHKELKKTGKKHVFLDCRSISPDRLKSHFPHIFDTCSQFGINITRDLIPVVPAAHYMCGGVLTDHSGKTSIKNLYAIGEVACTGLHGANRLASNSLLEAVVFAHHCARDIVSDLNKNSSLQTDLISYADYHYNKKYMLNNFFGYEPIEIKKKWPAIRKMMWHHSGIVRNNNGLKKAQNQLKKIDSSLASSASKNIPLSKESLELKNILITSQLILESALKRKESRGLHYNIDYPEKKISELKNTVLSSNHMM